MVNKKDEHEYTNDGEYDGDYDRKLRIIRCFAADVNFADNNQTENKGGSKNPKD